MSWLQYNWIWAFPLSSPPTSKSEYLNHWFSLSLVAQKISLSSILNFHVIFSSAKRCPSFFSFLFLLILLFYFASTLPFFHWRSALWGIFPPIKIFFFLSLNSAEVKFFVIFILLAHRLLSGLFFFIFF